MDKKQAIIAEIPKLRRFARALTGDATSADDLVQDCLERALGRLYQWREQTNMRAWLFTILRNTHLNQLRFAARRGAETAFDELKDKSGGTPPAQGQRLMIRDLNQALEQLPEQQREVILLVGLEDMNYRDTAEILDIPVGTVMSRLSRARETLKKLMENGENGGNGGNGNNGGKPVLRRVK